MEEVMNSTNSRLLSILVAALSMSVLWASCANAMTSSYARESHGSKMQSHESKRVTRQISESALLKKAYELAQTVAHENDRTHKVQALPITFEMVPRSALKPNELALALQFAHNTRGRNWNADIKLSRVLKQYAPARQVYTILHELAHAYDTHLWDARVAGQNETSFESYPFLKSDMLACQKKWSKAAPEMSSKEWYADWQAIQWLKKYAPEHRDGLRAELKQWEECEKYQGISSLIYAPHEIQLKWLE
jgi:hypothetical protein